ncbi:MAG: hypothetical protein KAU02_02845 [Tenericutes bacterium]|nr:hypothetical protein [Mycoplasmatota bacterium]
MKNFLQILRNDFRNYLKYKILQIILVISFLFSAIMAFFPQIDSLILVYITVFVVPVVIFSTTIFIESEEKTLFPLALGKCSAFTIIVSKILSSLILLLIPLIFYLIVMISILNMNFSILLFVLVYILSAIMHITIGIVLAVNSKSTSIMSVSYIAYIVIFSVMPIFYSQGLVPDAFQYVLIVSPAYLSGVLFPEIILGYAFSPEWLIVIAVVLQIVYILLLTYFVARPYFKSYLIYRLSKGE